MTAFSVHSASCSCTSCVYRSRSQEPIVKQIIQGGTEIDKLYYGKFLPLRERKLLEKLIRTRDVYDNVRNQLLSSASSDQISLEHKRKRRDDVSTDKSSVVFKMVDLVDRGQIRSSNTNKLSSCCSCCSCETLRKIRKRMEKDKHKDPRVHRHIVTCEDIAKYCAEAEKRGRNRRNKLSSKLSSKIGAARLKIKKHLSEPCACTLSLSSMATRSSKAFKKTRSKKNVTESAQARKVVTIDQETKIAKLPRIPRKKVKNIQSSTTKDSGTELRSLKTFKIKKDSIILFKEKLLRKRTFEENQDVECEPGACNTDECIPEECLRKIKAKGVGDMRKRKYHTRHSETGRGRPHISTSTRTKKVTVKDSQISQIGPSPPLSMTTILKTKIMASFSKSEIKGKGPVSPKQWQLLEKGTGKQQKAYKKTKLTASITSIPKSKAKPQLAMKEDKIAPKAKPKSKLQVMVKDKRLEKKGIRVQVSPQSNLATCECKLSTKSTSSLTSVPKQKATKSRSKRIKSHEVASPPIRHKRGRQKSRREYQNVEEAYLKEPIEHDKAKREKREKPTHDRIKQRKKYKHSNTQFTGTLSKARQKSHLRKSASQARDLPFPRECEPLMCIPYECDPEKCAQILLSRSKSRGKSAMTSMDPLRRKSVGSAAFSQKTSQKTSSRSRTKSKHKQSKSAENFIRKSKYVSKEPPPQIVEKCYYPDRKAVKITSSFSIGIEFYKDTYPCKKDDEKKNLVSGHQNKINKINEHGIIFNDHGTGFISSRQNISSQSMSSESFKNIQVGHRLKRCFCTLKLLPKKQPKFKHTVSKRKISSFHNKELDIGPRKKRTQTISSGIAYVVPPATSTQASLLPYECEPFFCTPGECDPYECAERIKQRNLRAARHVSKETNTTVTPKKSKLAFISQSVTKSTSRPIHHQSSNIKCECKVSGEKSQKHRNRNIKYKGRHSPSSNVEGKVSERQAVRIGSNFNFNIQFSKTNINGQELAINADALKSDKLIKRERRYLQEKGLKVHKPHVRHETSETSKYVKTKQTYTEPFLQRCLCTLKLLKKNKKKEETLSPWRNRNEYGMHMQKKSVTTNRAEIRYNPELSKLFTYEWEPGLCIPKECDPYNEINIMPIHSKQRVLGVGSKSSLKISRYKCKDNFITTEDFINTHNKNKWNRIDSQQFKSPTHHTSIDAEAKLKEKRSDVFSAIKRYFRNFKFQKKRNKEELQKENNVMSESINPSYPLPNYQLSEYKSTRTRLSKPPYSLRSYKYAPNFYITRLCNPSDYYEETERRGIKRLHDHYVSTHRSERKSVMSITSDFSGNTISKSTISRLLNYKTNRKVRDKQRDIKAERSFSPSRHAARKGSNFSTNKDTKNRSMPSIQNTTIKNRVERYNTVSEISTVSRMTGKGTKNTMVALKHDISQANEIRKEVNASNVGFLLKRCFCTLGLQKKIKSETELRWHQPVTTQFVQVEENRHDITKSGCKVLNKKYGGESLKLQLPEGGDLFRENIIRDQNAKHLPNSRSFLRRTHVRSRINFDKMRCSQNKEKTNPFYRSFYALNVKVSKSKNRPQNKYRALDDNERRPGECPPNECDAVDCSKKVKRLKRFKASDTASLDSQLLRCYKRCKEELKKKKGPDKPITLGSDLSIRAGVYKDPDPYKSSRCRALCVGTDVRLNFDFFKEPSSRGFCRTEPISHHDRKEAKRSHHRSADLQAYAETQSKVTGISNILERCFCAAKLKNATKSDINQNRDVTRMVKDNTRYKSTTPLSHRREKRKRSLKSVQYKDYSQQQRKKSHRPTDRNNVTFCTNVNCVEFYNDLTQNNTKLNRLQERGEGDIGKQKGPIAEKKTVIDKCFCALKTSENPENEKKDKNKKLKFIDRCYCNLKHLKGQKKGKQLTPKQSMEMIRKEKKKCKQLDEVERGLETIMPYSKKKFRKLDSQSNLTQGTNQNSKQNQQWVCETCKTQCQPIKPDSKKKIKKLDGQSKLAQGPDQNTKQNQQRVCDICEILCQPYETDSKKKRKKLDDQLKLAQGADLITKQNQHGFCDFCKLCQPIKPEKKNKKLDGQFQLAQGKQNQQGVCAICKIQCQPIKPDSIRKKKIHKLDGLSKLAKMLRQNEKSSKGSLNTCCCPKHTASLECLCHDEKSSKGSKKLDFQSKLAKKPRRSEKSSKGYFNTCFCPKHTGSSECLCHEDGHLKGLCPVCRAIATGKFSKTKNKLPCTCKDQDLGKIKSGGNREKGRKGGKGGKGEPKTPVGPVVDNTPLFEITVNKANMRIVNKDEVLKNLGSSGKESKAMKKARAAIKKGNVDEPVMEMIIDSGNASIVNSDQVIKNINIPKIEKKGKSIIAGKKAKAPKKSGKKTKEPAPTSHSKKSVKKEREAVVKSHGSKCKCCVCRGLKKGKQPPGAQFSMQRQKLRPCVCGSVLCKKDWDRIYHEQKSQAAVKLKKCVCGSNICGEESSKMPELLLEGARQAEREKEMAKRAIVKEKLYQKARKKRAKEQKKALKIQNKMRKKQDKRDMKSIKKSENQGDISLMAESLIDLGTFGSKAFCDIARTICRAVRYPRDGFSDAREVVSDPAAAVEALHARAEGLGLYSTLSRIKQRMLRMPTAKAAVTTLEAYPATNYLIHMADKDPKKRMKKFKTKRRREPLDFQCSLYMASMRKRPCLRVYYMCPWFYPHCMSLLNLWKQLMDILLFISAVVVWSPCILCMELCRGCLCCCMCQG